MNQNSHSNWINKWGLATLSTKSRQAQLFMKCAKLFWRHVVFFVSALITANLISGITFAADSFSFATNGAAAFKERKYDQAIDCFTKAIQLNTNYGYAYYARGWAYEETKQLDNAIADLSEAARINPDFNVFLLRGNVFLETGNLDKAISDYSESIRLNDLCAEAWAARAYAFAATGKYENAINDYDRALQLNPNLTSIYGLHAYAYHHKGVLNKAIDDYNTAIKLNPADATLYAARGLAVSECGNYTNGIADCQKAIKLDPKSAVAYNNLAWLLSIAPNENLRDGKTAVEYAKKSCEIGLWKEPRSLGTLAAAYAEAGNFDEAVKWQKKSLGMNLPTNELKQARLNLNSYEQKKPYHTPK